MEGVRVMDSSGKVLHTIRSVGEEVSIGRDRKCGIALAIDANGVSRMHGFLKWTSEDQLILRDDSTYGTVVNGKLVKGACQTIQDGSRIFVGDVELVIVFPKRKLKHSSSSCSTATTLKQDLSSKRKGTASGTTESESKRSKLDAKNIMCSSGQAQISLFFAKKTQNDNHNEENCITLAKDTPQSQLLDHIQNNSGGEVSIVADSAGSFTTKPENSAVPNSKNVSSGNVRRKKQCIFDVNMPPPTFRQPTVFAADTPECRIDPAGLKKRSGLDFGHAKNDITCIRETCERTMQSLHSPSDLHKTLDTKKVSSFRSTGFGKQISALHTQTISLRNPDQIVSSKKTVVFDCRPSSVASPIMEIEKVVSTDEGVDSPIDIANVLKLVSSGKRYDDIDDDHNDDVKDVEGKGIEIERVVAKLSNLVHYADIECRPARFVTDAQSGSISMTKCVNFKRFKKAHQGKFNASLASGNTHCIIGDKDDLVDFRQLSHVS